MVRTAVAALAAALITGCAAPRQYTPVTVPFSEAEYAALPTTGRGIVRGQVFAKTVGGEVMKGAGSTVRLMPATKARDEWYRQVFVLNVHAAVNLDPRVYQFDKTKVADGEGRFEFTNVPPGRYYVLSDVRWEAVSSNPYSRRLGLTDTQGGVVIRTVEVSDGVVAEAMLAR